MFSDQSKFNVLCRNAILNIFNRFEHSTVSFITLFIIYRTGLLTVAFALLISLYSFFSKSSA